MLEVLVLDVRSGIKEDEDEQEETEKTDDEEGLQASLHPSFPLFLCHSLVFVDSVV